MNEMIEDRRQSSQEDESRRSDLFSNLINGTSLDSNEREDDRLLRDELMGSWIPAGCYWEC